MSIRLKGQSFASQARSQKQEQPNGFHSPFGFAMLACESCVWKYLSFEWPNVDEAKFHDHIKRMRSTYPKKFDDLLSRNAQYRARQNLQYEKIERILKEMDLPDKEANYEKMTPKEIAADFNKKFLDASGHGVSAKLVRSKSQWMQQYYRELRIWSLGLALSFLDPKVGQEASLLQEIRQCPKLDVGRDFNINYHAVLDKEIYNTLKNWWKFVEDIGRSESDYRMKNAPEVILRKHEKKLWWKSWRRCDLPIHLINGTYHSRYELMLALLKKWHVDLNDPPAEALTKKYLRAIAIHALDDEKSVKEMIQFLESDLKEQNGNSGPVESFVNFVKAKAIVSPQQKYKLLDCLPTEWTGGLFNQSETWAPVALKCLLEGVAKKCNDTSEVDTAEILQLLKKAKDAWNRVTKHDSEASTGSLLDTYWMTQVIGGVEKFAVSKEWISIDPATMEQNLIDL